MQQPLYLIETYSNSGGIHVMHVWALVTTIPIVFYHIRVFITLHIKSVEIRVGFSYYVSSMNGIERWMRSTHNHNIKKCMFVYLQPQLKMF